MTRNHMKSIHYPIGSNGTRLHYLLNPEHAVHQGSSRALGQATVLQLSHTALGGTLTTLRAALGGPFR